MTGQDTKLRRIAAGDHPIAAAVLVAAGSGSRLGAEIPKAFVTVAGTTLLEHAYRCVAGHPRVRDVIVAAPAELTASAAGLAPEATVVAGGSTRQESVRRALAVLAGDVEIVLVHDVARAFAPTEVIDRVLAALASAEAVVPVLAVSDTVRRGGADGVLGEVVDRDSLLAVQTPQGFRRDLLMRAHDEGGTAATDDAALVQAIGARVVGVPGDERAFKVTVPFDLVLAEAVAGRG